MKGQMFAAGTTPGEAAWLIGRGLQAVSGNAGLYLRAPGIHGQLPSVDHRAMVRDAVDVAHMIQEYALLWTGYEDWTRIQEADVSNGCESGEGQAEGTGD